MRGSSLWQQSVHTWRRRGRSHTCRAGLRGSWAESHQTQRPGQQQSWAPDPSAVQQGGAQRPQPGPVAACLGQPQRLVLQPVPGLPTVLRTAGFHLETGPTGERLQRCVPAAPMPASPHLPPGLPEGVEVGQQGVPAEFVLLPELHTRLGSQEVLHTHSSSRSHVSAATRRRAALRS